MNMREKVTAPGLNKALLAFGDSEKLRRWEGPIFFLGAGSVPGNTGSSCLGKGTLLQDNAYTSEECARHYLEVRVTYEALLPRLARCLSVRSSIFLESRSAKILLAPWLELLTAVVLDSLLYISKARAFQQHLVVCVPDFDSREIPRDTLDFVEMACDERQRARIVADVLAVLDGEDSDIPVPVARDVAPRGFVRCAYELVASMAGRMWATGGHVILYDCYFPLRALISLSASTRGRVRGLRLPRFRPAATTVDNGFRAALHEQIADSSDTILLKCVSRLAGRYLPQLFHESLETTLRFVERSFPPKPAVIITANGLMFDDPFKLWCASSLAGASRPLIFGVQHGGDYGLLEKFINLEHELAVSDQYFGWNSIISGVNRKVTVMHAPKLMRRRLRRDESRTCAASRTLLVTAEVSRYTLRYLTVNSPGQFVNYLDWQHRFCRSLLDSERARLHVRLHHDALGWQLRRHWAASFPQISIETAHRGFAASLRETTLYVGDYISTTMFEALNEDVPVVLFWDRERTAGSPDAEKVFNLMRRVDVLHDSPESAATLINRIGHAPLTWWCEPARREAMMEVKSRLGVTTGDGLAAWKEKLACL